MDQDKNSKDSKGLARRILLSKSFIIAVSIMVIYTLAGFFLAPYLFKQQLTNYVKKDLGYQISIQNVRINPYAMTLDVASFLLGEMDGKPVLSFDRLFVNFELKSLFRRAWTFAEINLTRPELNIDIRPDKGINLARLMDNATGKETGTGADPGGAQKQDTPLPPLYFEHIRLIDGRIHFSDRSDPTPATALLKNINIDIKDITTLPDQKGAYTVTAGLPSGGLLKGSGEVSLQPIRSEGSFDLHGLKLAEPWHFLQDELNIKEPGGILKAQAKYRFSYAKKADLTVTRIKAQVSGALLRLKGDQDPILEIEKIGLRDGHFDLASRQITIGRFTVERGKLRTAKEEDGKLNWRRLIAAGRTPARLSESDGKKAEDPFDFQLKEFAVSDINIKFEDWNRAEPIAVDVECLEFGCSVHLKKEQGAIKGQVDEMTIDLTNLVLRQVEESENLLTLPKVALCGGRADLTEQKITIDKISLSKGEVALWRDSKGRFNWVRLWDIEERKAVGHDTESVQGEEATGDRPWSMHIANILFDQFSIDMADRGLDSPHVYAFKNISLGLTDFSTDPESLFGFYLSLELDEGGVATIKGSVNPHKPNMEATIDARNLALAPLHPYLGSMARLSLDSGFVSAKGNITYGISGPDNMAFSGEIDLDDILLTFPDTNEPLLGLKSLNANGIRFTLKPNKLIIAEVMLTEPVGKLHILEDRSLNLHDVIVDKERGVDADAVQAKTETSSKDEAGESKFPFEIQRIQIEGGKLDFADLSLRPRFGTRIHNIKGTVADLSSNPESRASLGLEGQVYEYGSVKISGEIRPLEAKQFTDVTMLFRNIEMTSLTPYSGKFAARKIASGKLSLDLEYRIQKRRLEANNRIIIKSLTLGENVESPDTLAFSLDLAIALLKDANDRIEIDLPVSGSLDDPKFSYSHLIWKALAKSLTKIVTAPFRALGRLLGIGGEDLNTVVFEAGRSDMQPSEKEKLAFLAKALAQRPQLVLQVEGRYNAEADGSVLRSVAVKREIVKRSGGTLGSDQNPGAISFLSHGNQVALDSLASERLSPNILEPLKKKFGVKTVEQAKGTSTEGGTAPSPPPKSPEKAGYYRALFGRLVEKESLDENALKQLAQKRAEAIIEEIKSTGNIGGAKLATVDPAKAGLSKDETVASKLKLKSSIPTP